jgi:transcription elongation factor Elf1
MVQEHIPLAFERQSGQDEKLSWLISTPSIQNVGIHSFFSNSTQEHFMFKCPKCGRTTELTFPESLVITADSITDPKVNDTHLICKECKGRLDHETKIDWLSNAFWVPTYSDRDIRGFSVNQFYSTTVTPVEMGISYLRGISNAADETEFFNSKLGQVHIVEGAKVNDINIDECKKSHKNNDLPPNNALITMGVDVGKWLHVEIDQWFVKGLSGADANILAMCKVIHYTKVKDFEDLDLLMRKYRVMSCVIDANPERRKALEFANRFYQQVKLCFYGRGVTGKQIHVAKDEPTITVDRTSWLDLSLGRFKNQRIMLPLDINLEYREHIKAPVRVYKKDADGCEVGTYVKGDNDQDHYAHARNYSELALPFAIGAGITQDIQVI